MRTVSLTLLLVVLFPLLAGTQTRPVPPGYVEAGKRAADESLGGPLAVKSKGIDTQQLKRDADEFSRLANAVPPQIEDVLQGKLPKSLPDNLKQLEKLAKKLRAELSPQ